MIINPPTPSKVLAYTPLAAKVDITIATGAAWNDYNASATTGTDTSKVWVIAVNAGAAGYMGARPHGSTYTSRATVSKSGLLLSSVDSTGHFDLWNNTWGSTEYYTAQASGTMAIKWNQIEANKDLLPVLQYQTIGDACVICAPLDGLTALANDGIWKKVYAPNHFNCKCIVTQHEENELKLTPNSEKKATFEKVTAEMDDVFKMNVGRDKYVFSPDHPYFDVSPKDRKYAANNFNKIIPEED